MHTPGIRAYGSGIVAVTLLGITMIPMSYGQQSPTFPSDQTANGTAGNATALATTSYFETARQQYLEAWNQTEFDIAFSTFIEPYSEQGFGVYSAHTSDVFRPGDTIALYVEPVGFSHTPVLDEQGETQYQMNLTARVAIEDESGNLLATIEDLPPFELVSHHKNTELFMTVIVTQQEPFPEGMYRLTYEIGDGQTGETMQLTKEIRVAQTVSS